MGMFLAEKISLNVYRYNRRCPQDGSPVPVMKRRKCSLHFRPNPKAVCKDKRVF